MKLHLGCGGIRLNGYINVDCRKSSAVDVIADARNLPFKDNSATLIESYHLIEHIPRRNVMDTLRSWYRLLRPAGKLVIECPDFDKNCEDYVRGINQNMQLRYIYSMGRWPKDVHFYGYNFERLKLFLEKANFTNIQRQISHDYHTQQAACLRVECQKHG